jgi:hypothetical protein
MELRREPFVYSSMALRLDGQSSQTRMESPMKYAMPWLLAATLTLPVTALAADAHQHGHAKQKMELNAGKRWATDDSLRQGMTAIRSSVLVTLPDAHAGKASDADYDAFGKKVAAQVAYIVQNCKLEPKADEQLHGVIAEIVEGAELAEGKHKGKSRAAGVVQVAQALNAYGKYFQHAGWTPVKLPH